MQARKLSKETKAFIKTLEIADPKAFDAARDLIVWLMLDEYFAAYELANGVKREAFRDVILHKINACGHDDWRKSLAAIIGTEFVNANYDEDVFFTGCETIFMALVDRHRECRIKLMKQGHDRDLTLFAPYLALISIAQHLRFNLMMAQLGSALCLGRLHKFTFDAAAVKTKIISHPLFSHCLSDDFSSQPYSKLNWVDFELLLNDIIEPSEPGLLDLNTLSIEVKIQEIEHAGERLLEKYTTIADSATKAREEKQRRNAESQGFGSRTPSATGNTPKLSHATNAYVPELADQMFLKLKHYFKNIKPRFESLIDSKNSLQSLHESSKEPGTAELPKKNDDRVESGRSQVNHSGTINWKSIAKGAGFGLLTALAVVGIAAIIYFSAGAVLPALAAVLVHTVGVIGFSGAAGIAAGLGAVGAVSGGIIQWVMSPQQAKPAPVIEMDNLATPDEAPEERKKAAFSVKDMVKAGLASMNCLSACFEMEPALTKSSRQVPRHINPTPTPQLGASHQSPRPQSGSQ